MSDVAFEENDFRSKGPELLVDLAEQCAQVLMEIAGFDDEKAHNVGQEIAQRMAVHWGGQNIYFPMGVSFKLSQRYRQIYGEFNGTNHSELARKFRMSVPWIYKIVKAGRQEDLARRQGDMFGK